MAISEEVEQVEDDAVSPAIEQLIEQKVEEKVEEKNQRISELEERAEKAEEERDELRQKVEDRTPLSAFRVAFAKFAEELSGQEIDDYTIPPRNHLSKIAGVRDDFNDLTQAVESHSSTLDSIGHGKAEGKEDAWNRVVEAANNLKGSGQNKVDVDGRYDVVIYWKDIKTATGFSDRYCKQLIEDFGEKRGATWQPYEPAQGQNRQNARRKRLYIDLDVWGDD